MGTQTQRAYILWSWLPNAHDDQVKCYSRSEGTNVKIIWKVLLLSLWYDVSCTAKEPTGSVAVYGQGNTSNLKSSIELDIKRQMLYLSNAPLKYLHKFL